MDDGLGTDGGIMNDRIERVKSLRILDNEGNIHTAKTDPDLFSLFEMILLCAETKRICKERTRRAVVALGKEES